jgi:hypothetical protein
MPGVRGLPRVTRAESVGLSTRPPREHVIVARAERSILLVAWCGAALPGVGAGTVDPMRWLFCAGAWLVANAAGLYVAAETSWGPVVVVLSERHGVHVGDILAVLVGVAIATTVTVAVWVTAPDHPPSRVVVAWVLCAAVWQVATVVSIFVAATTDWGPVVVRLLQKPVRLGDALALFVGVSVASLVTVAVWVGVDRSEHSAQAVAKAENSNSVSPAQ